MISVIVLNWNGKQHLGECLSSLREQAFRDFEVILVDNGSSDGSLEFVRVRFPEVRVLALPENTGFCKGNNSGIESARGELIALLNNDTRADRGWLQALYDCAERTPEAGLFASKMRRYDDPTLIDDAGDEFHVAGFASKRGWLQEDGPRYGVECDVFGACAGAAMYRRTMLDDIGLLDEHFFANGEDVDLSFRAQLRGYKCLYVPGAVVFHKGGASIGPTGKWFYWMRRNQLWIMMKNMPRPLLFKYCPEILLYNVLSLAYHSSQGRVGLIWSAYFDAFRDAGRVLRQRKCIQSRRTAPVKVLEGALTRGSLWNRLAHPITREGTFQKSYKVR